MGRIVKSEYILSVKTPVDGFCICSEVPSSAIPIIVHMSPPPPKQFVPPPNFAPQMQPMNNIPLQFNPNAPQMMYNPGQMANPFAAQPVMV